jgi:hypothetical protein
LIPIQISAVFNNLWDCDFFDTLSVERLIWFRWPLWGNTIASRDKEEGIVRLLPVLEYDPESS